MVALALLPPKHKTLTCEFVAVNAVGSVIVTLLVFVQLLSSVTVTV